MKKTKIKSKKPKAKVYIDGDSDFHNLVKKLEDFGKKVIIFSSRKMIAWELKLSASEYIFLEDLKKKIIKKAQK